MSSLTPSTHRDYYSPILAGEATPTVYHSLVEAAIQDDVAPERIMTTFLIRESLWSAVSVTGAALILLGYWWAGLCVMGLAVWASMKHTEPLNVRLGYCAAVDPRIGDWGVSRGYLSLIPIPTEHQGRWAGCKDERIEQAWKDVHGSSGRIAGLLSIGSTVFVFLAKFIISVLLLANAVRHPSWINVCVGGLVGAFFLLQSLARLPIMLGGIARGRSTQ